MSRTVFSAIFASCLLVLVACTRDEPAPAAPAAVQQPLATVPQGSAPPAAAAEAVAAPAPAVQLALPRTVTVGSELAFTIAEATIEPRNSESVRLVLLIQMQNKRQQSESFADENFRLLTKDAVIAANGGVAQTVEAGSESALERLQFTVPVGAAVRALQIEYGGQAVEVPLRVK